MTKPKSSSSLLLVDGNSLLYRSFFAMPRLTNREGLPTNAVYGFATVLRKLLTEEKPDLAAVVFDAPGKTFRHDIYREYKANRPATPDDLAAQAPFARRLCEVLGLSVFEIKGVEADDVIGTLAKQAEGEGCRVYVVSSDKDFLQLVSNRLTVLHPGKDLRYDPKAVEKRFGVPPDKVIDVLGLMGDSVDNVPGVPGIGEKGAISLIQRWGSLESSLENAGLVKNKRQREGLTQHADQARLSKTLVRIATDVEVGVELEQLTYEGADREAAYELFEKLEFTTLLKDYLPDEAKGTLATYRPVESAENLDQVLRAAKSKNRMALHLLQDGEDSATAPLRGVGLAVEPGEGYFSALGGRLGEEELFDRLGPLLTDESLPKVGHDLKHTWRVLAERGIDLAGIGFDVMIASYVLNPGKRSHDLDVMAMEVLQEKLSLPEADGVEQKALPGMEAPSTVGDLRPAAERAEVVVRLQDRLEPRIDDEGLGDLFREIELPLIRVLAEMEKTGIALDVEALHAISEELAVELGRLTEEIHEIAGGEFNINSPKQVGEVLFDKMNLPVFQKTQKQRVASTRMDILEELALQHPLPRKILDFRSLSKLKGTYVDALPDLVNPATGRIHTTFNQSVAATGRLSSSDPNLQNIPIRTELGRRIRSAFVPQPGWKLLSADYSQIELRVLAHMSGEPSLIEAFRVGEDIHQRTASRVFGGDTELSTAEQRRRAKIINFGVIYGKTAFTLGNDLGVSRREAQEFIDAYFEGHPKVQELLENIIGEARRSGKVRTLFGRQRYIPEIGSRNRVTRQAAERVAVNAPIQGTAADLIKKAMVHLWRELWKRKLCSRMLLQVHDELLLEVPEDEEEVVTTLVRDIMESVYPMKVPLKVETTSGTSWLH